MRFWCRRGGPLGGLVLLVLVGGWFAPVSLLADPRPPGRTRVLVLHSYNEKYAWTRSIGEGLAQGLEATDWDLWYEYLDAKNLSPQFDYTAFDPLLTRKYADQRFDLVVTVDDPAYLYFERTRATTFRDAKALAIGLNIAPATRLLEVSYIIENPDYGRTLNLALDQFPGADTIHIVIDRTTTSRIIRQRIESLVLNRAVQFDWIDSGNAQDIVSRCAALPAGEILCFAVYFDPSIGYISNDWLLQQISSSSQVPVYGFWTFIMEPGATGGFLYDGNRLGREAAQVAQTLVASGPPVYREESLSSWVFDWPQVQRFALPSGSFPASTTYLNPPPDFWAINKAAVISFLLGFGVLVAFLGLILNNLRTKQKVVASSEQLIATQRELMASLGDVIETRSEETASHVQRITRLSVLLADLLGLPDEQRQQLEVCASMHDIGKIGIPDAILKNSGQLSPEEREIMKTHTTIGHSIFRSSPNPMFQAAATIALEHHEKWDGTGYPQEKSRDSIDILARIVSIVDVFDALMTKRVYKDAWEPGRVRTYIEEESGRAFDPVLVEVFLDHWDEFCAIREDDHGPLIPRRARPHRGKG